MGFVVGALVAWAGWAFAGVLGLEGAWRAAVAIGGFLMGFVFPSQLQKEILKKEVEDARLRRDAEELLGKDSQR